MFSVMRNRIDWSYSSQIYDKLRSFRDKSECFDKGFEIFTFFISGFFDDVEGG